LEPGLERGRKGKKEGARRVFSQFLWKKCTFGERRSLEKVRERGPDRGGKLNWGNLSVRQVKLTPNGGSRAYQRVLENQVSLVRKRIASEEGGM